jgi:hypothetical protein
MAYKEPPGGAGGAVSFSAGTASAALGSIVFSNSGGVSFGLNGSTITASVGAAGGGLTNINLSAGTTSQNLSAVTFSNLNGVSFGLNGSVITGSVATNYLTTARASTDAIGLNTAATNVTWTVNSSGLSLNASGYVGTPFATTTIAGSVVAATHNSAGVTLAVPAYLTTAQAPGAYLTTARASNDAVGLNTAATQVTWTVNSSGISLNAGAYLTTAALSNHSHGNPTLNLTNLSGTTASNSAGFTLSLSAAAPGGGGLTNVNLSAGTTSQNLSNFVFSNSNGVSFGLNGSTVTATVATNYQSQGAYLTTARASNDAVGLNTAQTNVTWTVNSSGLSLNAAGYAGTGTSATNASITMNSNGLAISVAAPGGGGAVNFSAGTTSQNLQSVVFANSNGVTFGLGTGASSQSVTASVNAGGAGNTLSYYQNIDAFNGTQTMSVFGSTVHVQPFEVPYAVSASYIRFPVSQAMTSTSFGSTASSRTGGYSRLESHNLVIYSRGTGANSQSLQYVTSTQGNLTWAVSYSVATNGTQASSTYGITFQRDFSQTNTQFSSSQSATTLGVFTNNFSNFSAAQYFVIPFAGSLSPGQYWLAYGVSSSTSTSGFTTSQFNGWSLNRSFIGVSQVNSNFNLMGSTTNSTNGIQFGLGSWTTNSLGGTVSSINLNAVSTSASGMRMFFNMVRIT